MDAVTPSASLDFNALWSRLWRGRFVVLACALLAFVAGVLFARSVVPVYSAALRVTAARLGGRGGGGGGGGGGALQSFATLTGLGSAGATSATPLDLYLATLTSRATAAALARDPVIMHTLFAGEWDAAAGRWRPAPSWPERARASLGGVLGLPKPVWRAPDSARVQAYLERAVTVDRKPTDPITTVRYAHPDPAFAARLLNRLDTLADARVRAADLTRARSYIAYLSVQLAVATQAEQRLSLAAILAEQQRAAMTAGSGLSYAAEPIEPAMAPITPGGIGPLTWVVIITVVGLLAGCVLAVALYEPRRRAPDAAP